MGHSPEELGLTPDLSRLPSRMQDLVRHGNHRKYPSCSETSVAVCAEMFRAHYGLDEVWMVMTIPANSISEVFFEKDGEDAEACLEKIISRAHETAVLRADNE